MSGKPRRPAKPQRDARRVGPPPAATEPGAQDGRAWVRPSRPAAGRGPAPGESSGGPLRSRDDGRSAAAPVGRRADAKFRMQLGEAADEEAAAHRQDEARQRVERLRPWISVLFLAAVLSLLFYLASLVMRAAGASETAAAIVFLALLSGGLVVWVLGMVCALRLRDWPWLVGIGLTPFIAGLGAALIPLPLVVLYPLLPIAGLAYAWSKRAQLFGQNAG